MFIKNAGRAALALASVSLFGCGVDMDHPDGDDTSSTQQDTTTIVQGLTRGDVDNRAWQWVNAGMPYCQAVAGAYDSFCGKTCTRTGAANNATWNAYRSDCSGLVSWAWGMSPPGVNTTTLYNDTNLTQRVGYWDMQMGDAITTSNGSTGHTMIFHGWNADGSARIFQEIQCGTNAQDRAIAFVKMADGSLKWTGDNNRIYWPTRKKVL